MFLATLPRPFDYKPDGARIFTRGPHGPEAENAGYRLLPYFGAGREYRHDIYFPWR